MIGKYTYSEILNRVRVTVVAMEINKYLTLLVYMFSCLSYPACKSHAPYYIIIRELFGSIQHLFTLFHKRHEFMQKQLWKINCVF